jgi:tetratricopeptide (TPR) repeat protein
MRNIKRYFVILFFIIYPSLAVFSNDLFNKANEAYNQKDYSQAIILYEDLIKEGYADAMVYYNLGNTYYKDDQLAKSLLWYERALRLDPTNEDIKHNINFVNQQTIDKMETQPEFFLKTWISAIQGLFSAKVWAIISIVFGILLCGSIALMLILSSAGWRKGFFTIACISFVFLALSIVFSGLQTKNRNRTDEAVIMQKILTVKSTPDASGTDLFTVHEGLKIQITDQAGSWIEVRFANGNKGWIPSESVEII